MAIATSETRTFRGDAVLAIVPAAAAAASRVALGRRVRRQGDVRWRLACPGVDIALRRRDGVVHLLAARA